MKKVNDAIEFGEEKKEQGEKVFEMFEQAKEQYTSTANHKFIQNVLSTVAEVDLKDVEDVAGEMVTMAQEVGGFFCNMVKNCAPGLIDEIAKIAGYLMPGVKPLYAILKKVVKLYMAAQKNEASARQLGKTIEEFNSMLKGVLSDIFAAAEKAFTGKTSVDAKAAVLKEIKEQAEQLNNHIKKILLGPLEEAAKELEAYHKADGKGCFSKLWRGLNATDFEEKFTAANKKIDTAKNLFTFKVVLKHEKDIAELKVDAILVKDDVEKIKEQNKANSPKSRVNTLVCAFVAQHPNILKANPAMETALEVYVALNFGLQKPPLHKGVETRVLETLSQKLLTDTLSGIAQYIVGPMSDFDCKKNQEYRVIYTCGEAGSGKSTLGWRTIQQYDQLQHGSAKSSSSGSSPDELLRIPIFISLPLFKPLIEKCLQSHASRGTGLTDFFTQVLGSSGIYPDQAPYIQELSGEGLILFRKTPFVFFLDGLDELVDEFHIGNLCNVDEWSNSVFVITGRTQFLVDAAKVTTLLAPVSINGAPRPEFLKQIYLLPFGNDQQIEYIRQFAAKHQHIYPKFQSNVDYEQALQQFPDMRAFFSEPLLMYLVLSVLPTCLSVKDQTDSARLSVLFLQVESVKCLQETDQFLFPIVTRGELYALFTYQWARREVVRQLKADVSLRVWQDQPELWEVEVAKRIMETFDLCKTMAFKMFSLGLSQLEIADHSILDIFKESRSKSHRLFAHRTQSAQTVQLVSADIYRAKREDWQCSPLKKLGNIVSFLHKTVQEYFVALAVLEQLETFKPLLESSDAVQVDGLDFRDLLLSHFFLNKGNDTGILRFCADLVDKRVQEYCYNLLDGTVELQIFSKKLWDIVQVSRRVRPNDPHVCHVATAAGNALMILNAAGIVFDRLNFSCAKLGYPTNNGLSLDHGYVNLSGGIFSACNFSNAVLTGSHLHCTILCNSTFDNAQMDSVQFGERPTTMIDSKFFAVSPKFNWIVDGYSVWDVSTLSNIQKLKRKEGIVTCVAWSPDGSFVVIGTDKENFNNLEKWTVDTSQLTLTLILKGHLKFIHSVAVSSDGAMIVSASQDNTAQINTWDAIVNIWNAANGECMKALTCGSDARVVRVIFSPNDCNIVYNTPSAIHVFSVAEGNIAKTIESTEVNCLTFSHAGTWLAACFNDNFMVKLWAGETFIDKKTLLHDKSVREINSIAFSQDSQLIATATDNKKIFLWNVEKGDCVRTLEGHTSSITTVVFFGPWLLSSSQKDKHAPELKFWDMSRSANTRQVLACHNLRVSCAAFSPNSRWIISGSSDCTIKRWEVSTGECLRTYQGHTSGVTAVAFSLDSTLIVSGSENRKKNSPLILWDVETGSVLETFEVDINGGDCTSLTFSPDQIWIAAGHRKSIINLWPINIAKTTVGSKPGIRKRGECIKLIHYNYGAIDAVSDICVAFSPDSAWLASGTRNHDGQIGKKAPSALRVWTIYERNISEIVFDDEGLDPLKDLPPGDEAFYQKMSTTHAVFWDRVHQQTIFFGWSQVVEYIRYVVVVDWEYSAPPDEGKKNTFSSCVFSPDCSQMVTGCNADILLWQRSHGAEKWILTRTIPTQTALGACTLKVALSSAGKKFVSTTGQTIQIWSASSGLCEKTIFVHRDYGIFADNVSFSPDGTLILSTGGRAACVWLVATGQLRNFLGPLDYSNFKNADISKALKVSSDHTLLISQQKVMSV
ncbi:unannotated protein [freshwater metagenome]|uniref:Unannotated protein n=1 Tax=freshwater metagenome TaxID=449393 RepID=A0A6J7GFM1_9ZZZZ